MDECQSNDSSSRKIFCVHCDSVVSKSTYYRHRAQFFDPVNNVWNLKQSDHVIHMENTNTAPEASQRVILSEDICEYSAAMESLERSGSDMSIHEKPPESIVPI